MGLVSLTIITLNTNTFIFYNSGFNIIGMSQVAQTDRETSRGRQRATVQFKRGLCIMTVLSPFGCPVRTWSRGCGAAWKQTAASRVTARAIDGWCERAPRAGRQYRVARAGETEYRRVTDRYHNHTSPLIASTCWIKHTAFLPRVVTPSKLIQVHFTLSEKDEIRKPNKSWHKVCVTNVLVL